MTSQLSDTPSGPPADDYGHLFIPAGPHDLMAAAEGTRAHAADCIGYFAARCVALVTIAKAEPGGGTC